MSHTLRWANRSATVVLGLVLAVFALGAGLRIAGVAPLVEHSGSMAPAIATDDVVLVRDAAATDLLRGQIATIPDPVSGRLITHRVVSVERDGDRVTVVTRGDANDASERWVLRSDARVGRVAGRLPLLGGLLRPLGALPGTVSDFTASATNSGNSFTATAAPEVTATAIGKSTGGAVGYVKRSGTFYVYADATDDAAVSSVRATLTNVTGSSTAVTLTAGSYATGGVSYGYRSAQLTASSSLTAGAKSFTVTATDAASLTATLTGSVTADITAPAASTVTTTNGTGGNSGRAEQGDSATVTFSEAIEPDAILAGWNGNSRNVQAAIVDGGAANDVLRVSDTGTFDVARYLPIGTFELGRTDFLSGGYSVFGLSSTNGTPSTMTLSGRTLTIVLGSLDSGSVPSASANASERYTPVATLTDLAGNASGTTAISGSAHKVF